MRLGRVSSPSVAGEPSTFNFIPGLTIVQLRTTKVNKLSIMGTRIFSENLTTDPTPDGQKKNLEGVFIIFPRVFGCAKILSKNFDTYD